MHIHEGEMRAYLDSQLAADRQQEVTVHLEGCQRCRIQLDAISSRQQETTAILDRLESGSAQTAAPSPQTARLRLDSYQYQNNKEQDTMWNKLFSPKRRPAWAAFAVILILAVSMAFPPVRAIANSFLGLFRVQQITMVNINTQEIPDQLGNSTQFAALLSNDFKFEGDEKTQTVGSREEASALVGYPVQLPEILGEPARFEVSNPMKATFVIDAQRIQAILDEIGQSDLRIPKQIDGKTVTAEMYAGVSALYGNCPLSPEEMRAQGIDPDTQPARLPNNCTRFMMMPSPTVDAPPGLDLEQIGITGLQVLGMSKDEAVRFAKNVDWTTTLVVPIPNMMSSREVQVNGVTGTLITDRSSQRSRNYVLIWVKDGMVYALFASGNGSRAVTIAETVQ